MPAGKDVEDSYSSELTGLLKSRGLDASFKKSYQTIAGRCEPDVTIRLSDGIMLLEAKLQPAGLPAAMRQVEDYRRNIGKTERIRGIFAVVYAGLPNKYNKVYYWSEQGADLEEFKTLEALADFVSEKTKEKPAEIPPISTQKIIRVLDESVNLLSSALQSAPNEEIETVLGGRNFFSTVLDYDQEGSVSDAALKNAAAYLLVNQILFYEILSKETGEYPSIDPYEVNRGLDLQSIYFNKVLKKDYKPVFGFGVAQAIRDDESREALRTVITVIQLLSSQKLSHDFLGKIFHNLIPFQLRKVIAAYYTNSEAAELLASLAVEGKNDKVIDPSCGSGTLLVAAYNRKKNLYSNFTDDQHARFLENEIYGCDIMPFAAHLAAVNLALQKPLAFTNKVNVAVRDSTDLAPGVEIESAQEVIKESYKNYKLTDFEEGKVRKTRPKITKGVIDLLEQERSVELPKFDVVIMNPPFTRFQRIPPEYKRKLAQRFHGPRYREIIHGQMGLHGYFLLLADKLLAPGGKIAAVLPLTTISLEGFYGVIKLLLSDYQIQHIIASSGRAAFSENTSLREILLVAKKEKPVPETTTKFTFIHASPEQLTIEKARDIADRIRAFANDEEYNDDFYVRQVNQNNLSRDIRSIYQTVTLHSPELVRIDAKIRKWFKPGYDFCPLGEIEEREKWQVSENPRGIEGLGYYALSLLAPDKALKDHDVWLVESETPQVIRVRHRFNNQSFRIPRNCVVPQFRRFSNQSSICLTPPLDYLVIRSFDGFDDFLKASAQADSKLQRTIKESIREGEWERFVKKNSAHIFGFYRGDVTASGTNVVAIRSDSAAFAGPGGSWVFHAPQTHDKLTTLWLNSSISIYHILRDRKETRGGFIELDKYVFLELPYPIQSKIKSEQLDHLDRALAAVEFPSLLEQFQIGFEPRKKLDSFFLELAGVKKEEAERFLILLYDTLAKELLRLKGVMGK